MHHFEAGICHCGRGWLVVQLGQSGAVAAPARRDDLVVNADFPERMIVFINGGFQIFGLRDR